MKGRGHRDTAGNVILIHEARSDARVFIQLFYIAETLKQRGINGK